MSSPMKAKGVGELGICGVGAAVANAVYNATGVRVRDYPVVVDGDGRRRNPAEAGGLHSATRHQPCVGQQERHALHADGDID